MRCAVSGGEKTSYENMVDLHLNIFTIKYEKVRQPFYEYKLFIGKYKIVSGCETDNTLITLIAPAKAFIPMALLPSDFSPT